MINRVESNIQSNSNAGARNTNNVINVQNSSLNDLQPQLRKMIKNKEVSIKDCLLLIPLEMRPIQTESGYIKDLQFGGYIANTWNNPNKKINLLAEFESILEQQIKNKESEKILNLTRGAISVLNILKKNNSFESLLNEELKS